MYTCVVLLGNWPCLIKHAARESVLKEGHVYCYSPVQGVNDSGKGEESVDIGRCVTRMISSSAGSKEQVHGMYNLGHRHLAIVIFDEAYTCRFCF